MGDRVSLGEAIRVLAREAPDAPSITDDADTFARADVERMTDVAAAHLAEAGVGVGSVVAFTGRNSARLLMLYFAIWKRGATPLALSSAKSAQELRELLALAQPKLAVGFEAEVVGEAPLRTLEALFVETPGLEPPPIETPPCLRIGASGGSTGRSKLILVQAPALIDTKRPWPPGMSADSTHLVPTNIVDGTGFTSSTVGLATGSHMVLMGAFEPERALALIQQHRVTYVGLTPPLMLQMWKTPRRADYDVSSLRAATQWAGPAPAWLKRAWMDWIGPEKVYDSYGGTDSRGGVMINGVEWLEHPGSIGKPQAPTEVTILDDAQQPVPAGALGTIYLRDLSGRRRFEYIGGTIETLPGGWETIGDAGWMDEAGYLYYGDRRKDLIPTRDAGYVLPREVEGELERHPAVRSAIAIGLPDGEGHETIHAIVDAPTPVSAQELSAFLAEHLRAEKRPASYEFVGEPLRDTAGKARRSQLRDERLGALKA